MIERTEQHVVERIQALLDEELSAAEADSVRGHCRSCARCRQAMEESIRVHQLLHSDVVSEPTHSIWPALVERMHRTAEPRLRPAFTLGATAVVALGFFLGVTIGSMRTTASVGGSQDIWSEVGSRMTSDEEDGLLDTYVTTSETDGI